MLTQRIITAAILIPAILLTMFFVAGPAFLILTAIIFLFAAWEWTNLMQLQKPSSRAAYVLVTILTFVAVLYIPLPYILGGGFIWWLLALVLVMRYPANQWWSKSQLVKGAMGLLVIVPCWAGINFVRNITQGEYSLLFIFLLVWGADTAAYFAGKRWGTIPLARKVSPGKTLQGAIAALLSAIVISLLMFWFYAIPTDLWKWGTLLAVITVAFSIVGDLFESMLKRQAGLKDSGKLLPGHGGLLDRIDSLTAAVPVFTFGWMVLAHFLK